ncbi:MAG: MoxR family ATPase [bacterium]
MPDRIFGPAEPFAVARSTGSAGAPALGEPLSASEFAAAQAASPTTAPGPAVLQDDEMQEVARRAARIAASIASVILGKEEVIRACVVALLAGGHVIVEDFPGVGKTLLAKSLARSVNCRFTRIQFTPDLLPSDVTGVSVFNQKNGEFAFRPGPIFANIVLADEINRASPKTQSSLLECMEERQATIDNVTHSIEPPFMVIATQNPIEYEGTYPLPEAQLDRFMMRLSLGYPAAAAEEAIIHEQTSHDPLSELRPVLDGSDVLAMTQAVTRVRVAPALRRYVVDIMAATREHRDVYLGASPRAGIALVRAAKALALLRGRDFVVPKDIKDLAVRVLAHRIMLSPDTKVHEVSAETVVAKLLETVPVPQGGG